MMFLRRLRALHEREDGVGVLTVVLLTAVVSALTVTASAITIKNLDNTRLDRQSLSALATSEAGVAQAVQYLRGGNLSALTCIEPAAGQAPGATCQGAGPSWTSSANPMKVAVNGDPSLCGTKSDCFNVWIGTVRKYTAACPERQLTPPQSCFGVYRVHSTGIAGGGPSARRVAVDVKVSPYPFPIGVFSETQFSGNGSPGIHGMSIFTNGCIKNRQDDAASGSGFQFEWDSAAGRPVLDLVYDQPAAAHSTQTISTSNTSCGSGSGGQPIHLADRCNPTFRWDQDSQGDLLDTTSACYTPGYIRTDGTRYPTSSKFEAADLQKYGYRPRGLSDAQYDALRSQAQGQGTYNIAESAIAARLTGLSAAGISSPVLFWDSKDVDLRQSHFPPDYSRALNQSAVCTAKSVTIVVEGTGHDLSYQGGNSSPYVVASIFVPDGTYTGAGSRNTIGTIFANNVDLGGSPDFYMDGCFANNPPGGTLDVQVTGWREDDSTDVN